MLDNKTCKLLNELFDNEANIELFDKSQINGEQNGAQNYTVEKGITMVDDSTDYRLNTEEPNMQQCIGTRNKVYQQEKRYDPKMLGEIKQRDQAMINIGLLTTPGNDPLLENSKFPYCIIKIFRLTKRKSGIKKKRRGRKKANRARAHYYTIPEL